MTNDKTWMGRPIPGMDRLELVALKAAIGPLQSVPAASFLRSDVDVRETSTGTTIGRSFKWAFLPAGELWSEEDRREVQSRLDEWAARHGCRVRRCASDPTGSMWKCHAGYKSNRSSPSRTGWTASEKHSTSAKCRDAAIPRQKPWPNPLKLPR